jgi:uncharacterized protein (TIGR03083 family)
MPPVWREDCLSRVSLIGSETKRLSALWRDFDESEWGRDTFCPGWTAADAISHVTTGGSFYHNSTKRALEGLPPEPLYGKDAKEFWAIRKVKGEELMALPRAEMMDIFDSTSAALQKTLEDIAAEDLDKIGYHPRGLTPVKAWIGMRLVELVIHDWDVRFAKEPGCRVNPEGVEGMFVFVPDFIVRLFNGRESHPFESRFHFRSTGPDREWTVEVAGDKASVSSEISGSYDAIIEADGEAHLLLPYGRLKRASAEEKGRLRIEGDPAAAENLLGVVYTKY